MNGINNIQAGQIINVQAYKHNGKLYRQWNGIKVLEVSPFDIILFMYKTKVIEEKGQKWVVREPTFWWFPVDEYYNTSCLVRKTGTYYYTNLASPPIFEDNTLKFIDYDLDIKAYPNLPVKVVDKNEYIFHTELFGYPHDLQDIINKTTDYVLKLIKNQDGYFNKKVIYNYLQDLVDQKKVSRKLIQLRPF